MTTAHNAVTAAYIRIAAGGSRYRSLFTVSGSLSFFSAAAIARLGVAMTGLGLLFTVTGATGSFATAGTATGLFALAEAVAGPQLARLFDRYGQTRILPLAVMTHAGAIGAVLLAASAGHTVVGLAAAAVAGATVPQPAALSAARWTHLLADRHQLRTAFSLEAAVNDLVFMVAPPIVTLASGLIFPWIGSVLAAGLLVVGSLVLAMQRQTAPPSGSPRRTRKNTDKSLTSRRFLATLGVNLGLGCFFGAVPLLVTAYAAANGYSAAAGGVLALSSVASLFAGLAYGANHRRIRPEHVHVGASAALVIAVAIAAAWLSLPGLCLMLILGGAAVAPLIASSSQIVETSVGRDDLTQGFTWMNTASAVGIAATGALVGVVIETAGVRSAAAVAIGLTSLALVSAFFGTLRRSPH